MPFLPPNQQRQSTEGNNRHYRTLTKTRKYVNTDGQVVTSQTSTIVVSGEENKRQQEHELWKADLRELKVLQKIEKKQYQDLMLKAQYVRDQQMKKFEQEMQTLLRNYEVDIDDLSRKQKLSIEKVELSQTAECKAFNKKLRAEQENELKLFRENHKHEVKKLKDEVESVPKEQKKDAYRQLKEEKDIQQAEKERKFLEQQQENIETAMRRLAEQHRTTVAQLERDSLGLKHQLLRAREAAIWELEEQHLKDKAQLAKRQLRDLYFLKRHQMITRHEKEMQQCRRQNLRSEDEILKRHALERRRFPQLLKQERKTRLMIFKESLRISQVSSTPEQDREKIKQFKESEKKRALSLQQRQDQKHLRQMEEQQKKNVAAVKELETMQNEKAKLLMDHEGQKMQELDNQYESELKEWKHNLRFRKQKLEDEFARQFREQEHFYGNYASVTTCVVDEMSHLPQLSPHSITEPNHSVTRSSAVL